MRNSDSNARSCSWLPGGGLMPMVRFIVVVPWICLPLLAVGQQLSIENDEYRYTAHFDPNRISESRLRELLLLSPHDLGSPWKVSDTLIETSFEARASRVVKNAIPEDLESCVTNDPQYFPCGSRDILDKNFFQNAAVNVARNQRAVAALRALTVPKELENILAQFRNSLAFYTTLEERRLEFLRSGDISAISKPIGEFAPSTLCPKELGEIEAATTIQSRYKLSEHEWHNCMNSAWWRTEPEYPLKDWRTFLSAYGIKERFIVKAVD